MLPDGEGKSLVEQVRASHATMGQSYRKAFETFKAAGFDAAAGDAAVQGMDREPRQAAGRSQREDRADSAAHVDQAAATANAPRRQPGADAGGLRRGSLRRRTDQRADHAADQPGGRLARRVAAGDLTLQIDVQGSDEIAQLLQALKAMQASLAEVVATCARTPSRVATASAQIAQGNSDLSQRTEEQASALEETAASMEELTSTVKQNADNARQANQLALGASTVARQGRRGGRPGGATR